MKPLGILLLLAGAFLTGACNGLGSGPTAGADTPTAEATTAALAAPTQAPTATPTATRTATPVPTYSPEEFKRRVIDLDLKGLAVRMELPPGAVPGVDSALVEAAVSTVPVESSRMFMSFKGKQDLDFEFIVIGDELFFRAGSGGETGQWAKTLRTADDDVTKNLPGAEVSAFSPKALREKSWAYLGDEACGTVECFVVQSQDEEKLKLFVRKSDYRPIKFIQTEKQGTKDLEITVEVLAWNEEVVIQPPAGEVAEVAPEEFIGALFGLIMSLAGGGG